jgi:RNA polymerase sigma-70 factor (ECF subfamily)
MSEIPDPEPENTVADPSGESEISPPWREVFDASAPGLRAFLRGRLNQDSDVDDCLQVVFVKMIESGGNVAPAARRSWLFRVAANESARLWRSKASTEKMLERHPAEEASQVDPTEKVILTEKTEKLNQLLLQLPQAWQQVVRLRINENLTFQQIADQLGIPLGTALTQMRRALERLKSEIESDET